MSKSEGAYPILLAVMTTWIMLLEILFQMNSRHAFPLLLCYSIVKVHADLGSDGEVIGLPSREWSRLPSPASYINLKDELPTCPIVPTWEQCAS